MADFTQEHRNLQLDSPFGKDVLLLLKLRGEEQVSRLFRFELDCFSARPDLDPAEILGLDVTVLLRGTSGTREISGVVSRFRQGATSVELTNYYLEVVPRLWMLARSANCRIFQEKSVPEIATTLFDELGLEDYALELRAEYAPRNYCVQYRESAFTFISRLLEEEGIWYFHRHADSKHTLVLADDPSAAQPCPDRPTARYNPERRSHQDDEIVFTLSQECRVFSTNIALRDFNYETPREPVAAEREEQAPHGPLEIYDYPGEFRDASEGNRYAGVRIQEQAAMRRVLSGESNCRGFLPGFRFELKEHPHRDFDRAWMITRVTHEASQTGSYIPGRGDPEALAYENRFEAIPSDTPFRPQRIMPRPVIAGAQTAVVTGPEGEEIHTDRFGRVKVHFHWDRLQTMDDTCSCWVRVSQGLAGKNWGMVFLPRVGHEVIVEFLEGDPDRPLITGRVHNAEALPPYDLPANKTISGIKTRSSKDAGTENLNVIRLEDKKGEEQIFIHAEKVFDLLVKDERHEKVESSRHLIVGAEKREEVGADRHEKVTGNHLEEIGGNRELKVDTDHVTEVSGAVSRTVSGAVNEDIASDLKIKVGGQLSAAGTTGIVLESSTGISLVCGGSSVVVDNTGVTITGTMVTLDGSMTKIGSGPGSPPGSYASPSAKSPALPEEPTAPDVATATERTQWAGGDSTQSAVQSETQDDEESHWIAYVVRDENGDPIPNEPYRLTLPDGTQRSGRTDEEGRLRQEGIQQGQCELELPRMDTQWRI